MFFLVMLKLDCEHRPKKGQKREFLSQEVGWKNASPSKAPSRPSNAHPAGWTGQPAFQSSFGMNSQEIQHISNILIVLNFSKNSSFTDGIVSNNLCRQRIS
jgi:hypothetical protein